MPWPIMRSNPTIRIVPFRTPPAKRSRRNCAACGPSSPSCAPTMHPSHSMRALGDFPRLPPRALIEGDGCIVGAQLGELGPHAAQFLLDRFAGGVRNGTIRIVGFDLIIGQGIDQKFLT